MAYYGYGSRWAPYVSVAQRRHKAMKKMSQLRKKGVKIQPIEIEGRKIVKTFWGEAWCDHMELLGDFDNRLPRGRTYVRNGSVCHLEIQKGHVTAMVSGSSLYKIEVKIKVLPKAKWRQVKSRCAGQIGSLLELLQGRLSDNVMEVVTDPNGGLFPSSSEIELACDCPDWAYLCKHLAAVLYGVGARLDQQPELLFLLRGVKHEELVDARADKAISRVTRRGGRRKTVSGDLGDVFGIELEADSEHNGGLTVARKKKARVKKKSKTTPSNTKKRKSSRKASAKSTPKKTATKSTKKKTAKKKASKKSVPTKKSSKNTTKKQSKKKSTSKKRLPKKNVKKGVSKKRAAKKKASTVKKSAVKNR